jgi:hypothetical protein
MTMSLHQTAVATALAVVTGASGAVNLPLDGTPVALPGTNVAARPHLAGIVVEDVLTPFSYEITDDRCGERCIFGYDMRGTLQSRVVKALDGTFDFYWRITTEPILSRRYSGEDGKRVEPTPPGFTADLSWAALSGFAASHYDADWRTDGPDGAAPRTAALGFGVRPYPGQPTTTGMTFYFAGYWEGPALSDASTLQSGSESRFIFLDTDARAYASSATLGLHSWEAGWEGGSGGYRGSGSLHTFAPAPIPEPAAWALMLLGLGLTMGAAAAKRRRRSG